MYTTDGRILSTMSASAVRDVAPDSVGVGVEAGAGVPAGLGVDTGADVSLGLGVKVFTGGDTVLHALASRARSRSAAMTNLAPLTAMASRFWFVLLPA